MKTIYLSVLLISVTLLSCVEKESTVTEPDVNITPTEKLLEAGRFTPELMWKLGRVSDAQLSPDKKTILYGITNYTLETNKGKRNLYTISVDGGVATQITKSNSFVSNGIWRPDGKKIGYICSKNGSSQLWEMNPDGSEKKQISKIDDGIDGFSYSPTLEHIAFTKSIKLDQKISDRYPDLPLADARIIDDLNYRNWNHWHSYSYSHIHIAKYENGNIGALTDIQKDEKFNASEIAWHPNGKSLAYICKKLSGKKDATSTNTDIYLYNITNKSTENLSKGMNGYDKHPTFSPDGNKLAWQSMKTPGFESDKGRLMIYDFDTKEMEDISANYDYSTDSYQWSNDGSSIYFISGLNATYQVFSINTESKDIKQITTGHHNYNSISLGDGFIIGEKMSMSLPVELFNINIKSGEEKQLTFTNKNILEQIELAKVEERWVETTDNKKMLVWVIYPPGFDKTKKYPAFLYCQGGPQSAVSQFFSYRWNFQIMAANDYIIIAPNRRGLPTFGREWNDQISLDYGGQNMKDYISAVDAIAKEPFIDEERIGAVGASYGGFSVYWLAGHHKKRFKAFIAHCGMFNLESWYGATDEYFFANHDLGGAYYSDSKPKSFEFSPHKFVGNWDTPILVIHGAKDFRIPETEGMQAFNCAQLQDIPSRFLYFPEETHFVLQPQNAVLWQREFFRWFDTYLK